MLFRNRSSRNCTCYLQLLYIIWAYTCLNLPNLYTFYGFIISSCSQSLIQDVLSVFKFLIVITLVWAPTRSRKIYWTSLECHLIQVCSDMHEALRDLLFRFISMFYIKVKLVSVYQLAEKSKGKTKHIATFFSKRWLLPADEVSKA